MLHKSRSYSRRSSTKNTSKTNNFSNWFLLEILIPVVQETWTTNKNISSYTFIQLILLLIIFFILLLIVYYLKIHILFNYIAFILIMYSSLRITPITVFISHNMRNNYIPWISIYHRVDNGTSPKFWLEFILQKI